VQPQTLVCVAEGVVVPLLFEGYLFDPDRRELTRGTEAVPVGPQVFDLLGYLLTHRDRVVSKDDLIEAVWGGRIISESTLTSHINAARKAIGDTGEHQRLIKTIARKGYRFVGEVREDSGKSSGKSSAAPVAALDGSPEARPTLALPDRPSLAVLPFVNLSGDPTQDYFVDGVVEDIIAGMSRMSGIFIIARNSSFTYKGRAVDVKQVGRELGVRYVVEGSMRKAADRVRITGQLIDATTGGNIWSERFEGTVDNIFDLQDRLSANVIGAIAPRLEHAEIERARHKPTDSLDAYDYYLRAIANMHAGSKESMDEAQRLFKKAIALDPDYAAAHAAAAWCYVWKKVGGWIVDREAEFAEGVRLARRALALGENDATTVARAGHSLLHLADDHDTGVMLLDRAKTLNPNLATAWLLGGFARIGIGRLEEAVAHMEQAMRLSPLDPEMYRTEAGLALAYLLLRRFDEASMWAARARRGQPGFLMVVGTSAAAAALSGDMERAEREMQELRRLNPNLRCSNLRGWLPLRRPEDIATLAEGLRKAGLPE
jgi:TolB-like protein